MSLCALVGWKGGGLPWIHPALSTLRPSTSPHLSAIRLKLTHSVFLPHDSAATLINHMGGDLRRTADEIDRIQHEYEGAVKLTVLRDPVFGVVFDTLGVSFRLRFGLGLMSCLFTFICSLQIFLGHGPNTPPSVWEASYPI